MKTAIIYLGQDPAYKDLPMVELNYIRDFSAHIVERGLNYVTLDRTAFYAEFDSPAVGDQSVAPSGEIRTTQPETAFWLLSATAQSSNGAGTQTTIVFGFLFLMALMR